MSNYMTEALDKQKNLDISIIWTDDIESLGSPRNQENWIPVK